METAQAEATQLVFKDQWNLQSRWVCFPWDKAMSCQKSRFQKIIDWLTSIEALWQIENTDRHAHQVAVDVI